MTINNQIKQLVRKRANYLCEYCHSPERISANRFTLDHIIPKSVGGSDDSDNLALACRRCNERHYNFITGLDPQTNTFVSLFNPRQQKWNEHFIWNADKTRIIGISPIGRATCNRLDLNDERYPEDDSIRNTRKFWVQANLHPPSDDSSLLN